MFASSELLLLRCEISLGRVISDRLFPVIHRTSAWPVLILLLAIMRVLMELLAWGMRRTDFGRTKFRSPDTYEKRVAMFWRHLEETIEGLEWLVTIETSEEQGADLRFLRWMIPLELIARLLASYRWHLEVVGVLSDEKLADIDPRQAWFWTETYQKRLRESQKDFEEGRFKSYPSVAAVMEDFQG